ncbi:hypothetical protein AB0L99_28225 [Streptomyces sp. NPDC051954]|uniref:hypothetical protein n=1 Tax=unclassified Streptomyces TaxID=2593676 RepID=UPI0034356876
MSDISFSGPIHGPVQAGDHNNMTIHGADFGQVPDPSVPDPERTAEALRLTVELLRLVGTEGGPVSVAAESLNSELDRSVSAGEPVDRTKVGRWLDTINGGFATGSGALALVEGIRQAVFGP